MPCITTLQLSEFNGSCQVSGDNRNSEKEMNEIKSPSEYKIENKSYERKPTAGIQEIAEKPFTVNHIDKFKTKANEEMVIITTDETFTCEYKETPESEEKIKGQINRFFASPMDIKKFFGSDQVIEDVNEKGNKIRTMIEKVAFTADEIKRDGKLKGKTHYIFKKLGEKQGKLGV